MSGINALEELRTLSMVRMDGWLRMDTQKIADNIEAEIAEHYMPLPVDGNGEPIHVGDSLVPKDYGNTVREVIGVNCKEFFFLDDEEGRIKKNRAYCWKHWKPRTLEDVLRDVVTLCANTWKDEKSAFRYYDVGNVMESGNIADFAAEIRELMGAES